MKQKHVWIIASMTLITAPLAFWVIGGPDTTLKTVLIYLAFSPLGISIVLELVLYYKNGVASEGSPAGNFLAKILGVLMILGVIAIVIKLFNT